MRTYPSLFVVVLLITLVCSLSACGFSPRGTLPPSPYLQHMYLQTSSNFTPLSQAIEKTLADNNIALASSSSNAEIVLKVFNEQQTSNLMTVGANQETRQYKLVYSLEFSLYNRQNKLILGPRTIQEYRTQIIQANQLLDNNSETIQLYDSMREQAVIDLMYQLTAKNTHTLILKSYEN